MSLFQPPSCDRQFETRNIRRLPHKRHHSQLSSSSPSIPSSSRPSSVLSSRPSTLLTVPDLDHLDLNATSEWSASSVTTTETKKPHQRKFIDRCLLVRTFHTPCGHITHLGLHEEPCKMEYYGIVPESSAAAARDSDCGEMDVHLAMRKRLCDHCAHSAAMVEGKKSRLGKWFGKGKSEGIESDLGDDGDSRWVVTTLSTAEIVATGNAWMKDVQMQRQRIEESRLRKAKEKMKNRVELEESSGEDEE